MWYCSQLITSTSETSALPWIVFSNETTRGVAEGLCHKIQKTRYIQENRGVQRADL